MSNAPTPMFQTDNPFPKMIYLRWHRSSPKRHQWYIWTIFSNIALQGQSVLNGITYNQKKLPVEELITSNKPSCIFCQIFCVTCSKKVFWSARAEFTQSTRYIHIIQFDTEHNPYEARTNSVCKTFERYNLQLYTVITEWHKTLNTLYKIASEISLKWLKSGLSYNSG